MRVYSYRSQLIRPCAYVDGAHAGRWYVQSYHAPTSMRWEDAVCAHYRTLRDARQAIREEDTESCPECGRTNLSPEKMACYDCQGADFA